MVNQGAITQCLPVAPLPIRDSRQNPRVLVPEPKVWEEGNTPTLGRPLFSPLPGMFLSPSKSTGVGCHFLLQGLNPSAIHPELFWGDLCQLLLLLLSL